MSLDWNQLRDDCVTFTQRLIQTPSMPFEEAAIAQLVAGELERLGFDEVWLDEIGNANGRIYGRDRELGALVLNSHLDHVDPGDPALWPVPPFSGEIVDGRILGRGACDIKGPLAVQVYSMAALLRAGQRPRRDVVFNGVVQEELGGAGAVHWAETLDYPVEMVVLGEPSSNTIALGHRGILQLFVTFHGRSVHASVPQKGDNPNYALATFLNRLREQQGQLRSHPRLGKTTVSPTIVRVDTQSSNVTPAWTRVVLDFRTAAESSRTLQDFVHRLAHDLDHTIGDVFADDPSQAPPADDETIFGYDTDPDDPAVQRAVAAISEGMGRPAELSSYQFATDGRHFVPYGLRMVGYSPAEEHLAHTVKESISIAMMEESLRGHVQLLRDF